MTQPYSATVAAHYAAYRPPLHQLILRRVLSSSRPANGLDVGCGTGRSSVALADYCEHVDAVDPSQAMLDAATPHKEISYHVGSAERLPVPDGSIDVVTFAGSLFYADLDAAVGEILRVARADAWIVVYDFEVLIDDWLESFDIAPPPLDGKYDHRANFSGQPDFHEVQVNRERISLELTASDLAHILLADARRLDIFQSRFQTLTPHQPLASELDRHANGVSVDADLFYSLYQIQRRNEV